MKAKTQNDSQPIEKQQPVFHKVAENLYRLQSSGGYYALLKRGGKQFRRSLKTKDRKLADRRLGELRGKVGSLQISPDAKLTFAQTANYWLDTIRHSLSSGTILRRTKDIKGRSLFLGELSIRNITSENCDHWDERARNRAGR